MPIAKSTRLGPYKVLSPLGSGSMSEVYLAEDTRLHRKVALKVLPADLASNLDRSDIFSFGCILCEATTRHRPFEQGFARFTPNIVHASTLQTRADLPLPRHSDKRCRADK